MALRFIPLLAPFLGAVFAAPTELPDTTTATETTSDNGSIIVVTATTGNPAAVVTYRASQDPQLTGITAKTTSSGTTFYPFGWFWAPVGEALPPVLPTPPEGPPEAQTTETQPSCTSTTTPTITVIIRYPTNSYGEHQTSIETQRPSSESSSCVASETSITTSTAPYVDRAAFAFTDTLEPGPAARDVMTVSPDTQKYLDDTFNSLGIGTADYAEPTSTAQGSCSDHAYEKAIPNAAAFIKGLSPSFCSDWVAQPTTALSKKYSAKDVKGSTKRSLGKAKRSPPPRPLTADSYPGWTIDFDWKPKDVSGDCLKQDYCNNALSSILSTCSGYSLTDAYKGGNITDSCGSLSYSVNTFNPDDLTCNLPTVNDIGSNFIPQSYPQNAYEAAAHQFCYGGYNWNADPHNTDSWTATNYFWFDTSSIDPATGLPAYCIGAAFGEQSQHAPASASLCKSDKHGLQKSDSKIWVQVVPSPVQDGCQPISNYKLPEGEQCYRNMMNVITTCMPEDGGGKVGVWKEYTPSGCWDWWLWGRVLT